MPSNQVSTQFKSWSYSPTRRELTLTFHHNSTVEVRGNISPEIYAAFEKDWSKGKFYHAIIKRQPKKFPIVS